MILETLKKLRLRILILLPFVCLVLAGPTIADPADWGESDWYKFFEMTVTVTMDKVHGGLQVPAWMKSGKPVKGRLPLLDMYSAVSAAGASVKPGLDAWLKNKILEAQLADDYHRVNVYQAYRSALAGQPGPLRRLQKKAQAALDKAEEEKASQSLVLNEVLASSSPSRQVEVVAQFTVGGNSDGSLGEVMANATVQGPKTLLSRGSRLNLSQPSGYQAGQFYLSLPESSPGGRYSVAVKLSDSRGLASQQKVAYFDLKVAEPKPEDTTDPGKTPPKEKTPTPTFTPSPVKSPEPEKPTKETERLAVRIVAPSKTPVGKVVQLTAQVNDGTPPFAYSWSTDGKRWNTRSVRLDYDTPGRKTVYLKVEDSRGAQGRSTATVQVSDGIAVNISGPGEVAQGRSVTYTPIVVTGPKSGFEFTWTTEGQQGSGPSFSPTFRTAGRKELVCRAEHPSHSPYQSTAYITVLENEEGETVSEPLTVSIAGPSEAEQGEVVTFTPKVKGGRAPYRYSWRVKGKSVSKKSIRGQFDKPGEHVVVLKVTDSGGQTASQATASLTVKIEESEKLTVGITGPRQAEVGEEVSFSPKVRGGTGPYRYVWTVKGKTVEKKTIRGKFDHEGKHSVQLAVYDPNRRSAEPVRTSTSVTVAAPAAKPGATQSRPATSDAVTVQSLAGRTYVMDTRGGKFKVVFTAEPYPRSPSFYKAGVKSMSYKDWPVAEGYYSINPTSGVFSLYWPANGQVSGSITSATLDGFVVHKRERYDPLLKLNLPAQEVRFTRVR